MPALSAALGVLAAVHAVILPLIARLWAIGHRERVQRLLELGVTVAAVAGVALSAGTVVAGHRVAGAVYGPVFVPTGSIAVVLGLALSVGPAAATGRVWSAIRRPSTTFAARPPSW